MQISFSVCPPPARAQVNRSSGCGDQHARSGRAVYHPPSSFPTSLLAGVGGLARQRVEALAGCCLAGDGSPMLDSGIPDSRQRDSLSDCLKPARCSCVRRERISVWGHMPGLGVWGRHINTARSHDARGSAAAVDGLCPT